MKVPVLNVDGSKEAEIELPSIFNEEYRPDIIKRAVLAEQSKRYQPKGADPLAGQRTTAESWGTGSGMSRIPRIKAGPHRAGREAKGRRYRSKGRWFAAAGRGAIIPGAVGGRQAHPPKAEKILVKKLNKKEYRKALRSAIAATVNQELVRARGHIIEGLTLPIIVDDSLLKIKKTKDMLSALKAIGLEKELARTKKRKVRGGKGKARGRRYKTKVGPLIVLSLKKEKQFEPEKGLRNIPGVQAIHVNELKVESLAPGSVPGRLTVWTKSSIKDIKERLS